MEESATGQFSKEGNSLGEEEEHTIVCWLEHNPLFCAGSLDGSAPSSGGKDEDQVVPGGQGGE